MTELTYKYSRLKMKDRQEVRKSRKESFVNYEIIYTGLSRVMSKIFFEPNTVFETLYKDIAPTIVDKLDEFLLGGTSFKEYSNFQRSRRKRKIK
jgi:hypothetical protein